MRTWLKGAIDKINADYNRSADSHLIKLDVSGLDGIDIYLKDESTHPTGSLKHRLARSLFLYALANGKINQNTTIIEASSGSTAVSEAYFAKMLGLDFIAVVPKSTAQSKIDMIEFYGGKCHFVDAACHMHDEAIALSKKLDGYFMDQFKFAERATDWRGNNNIAESIFKQMSLEQHSIPHTVVMSAGTGGTSATIGRYIRYKGFDTQLLVVDPENSVFYDGYRQNDPTLTTEKSSRIEGIGRPVVELSFQPDVIDDMLKVPDAASIAAMYWLEKKLGRKAGPSTGTNLWGVLKVAKEMKEQGKTGSIVTLMCDSGERYLATHYNRDWVAEKIGDITPYTQQLEQDFEK